MKKSFGNKKGTSPLIATILLISFGVALGTVVMSTDFSFVIGDDKCGKAEVRIKDIGGQSKACYGGIDSNGYIRFMPDRMDDAGMDGLVVLIAGTKGTKFLEINDVTGISGKEQEFPYDFSAYGNIKEIQFLPKVGGEICAKASLKEEKVSVC